MYGIQVQPYRQFAIKECIVITSKQIKLYIFYDMLWRYASLINKLILFTQIVFANLCTYLMLSVSNQRSSKQNITVYPLISM